MKFQTSIARLMASTMIVVVILTSYQLMYTTGTDQWGKILSVLLISFTLIGGMIGVLFGGVEYFFRGVLIAGGVCFASIVLMIVSFMIATVLGLI